MVKKIISYIKSDLYRYSAEISIKLFFKHYIESEGFRFSVWLRMCHFLRKKKLSKYTIFPICVFIYKHYKYKFGYDIPYAIDIGEGLLIFHISNIVVSAQKIGKNFTISQGCTVGMKIKNGKKEFPIIGNNVYMAPGSKIIGGVVVGDNVAIGTNCVLNSSVNKNSVVVGIPGRVISYKGASEYTNNTI